MCCVTHLYATWLLGWVCCECVLYAWHTLTISVCCMRDTGGECVVSVCCMRDTGGECVVSVCCMRDTAGECVVSVCWMRDTGGECVVSVCCMRDTHSQSAKPASHICRLSYSHSAHRGDLLKFLHTCHDALTSVTSHTSMCNVTHSCAWRDDFDMILLNRWFRQDFEQWWWFLFSSLSLPLSFSRTLFCTLFRILSLSPCFFLILSLSFFPLFNPY